MVQAVGVDETLLTLMGEGTADPKSTLIASGFEMRRVVLTTKRRQIHVRVNEGEISDRLQQSWDALKVGCYKDYIFFILKGT